MKKSDHPITVRQTYPVSAQDVWNAITSVEAMRNWYFPNIESFRTEPGFETRFVVQNDDRMFPHVWTIVNVNPLKNLRYEWRYEGYPGLAVVDFDLSETDDATELTVTFTVLEDFSDDIHEFKRERAEDGWRYLIKDSLKNYLNR